MIVKTNLGDLLIAQSWLDKAGIFKPLTGESISGAKTSVKGSLLLPKLVKGSWNGINDMVVFSCVFFVRELCF